jgi:hypothetical protein
LEYSRRHCRWRRGCERLRLLTRSSTPLGNGMTCRWPEAELKFTRATIKFCMIYGLADKASAIVFHFDVQIFAPR